MKFKSGTSLTKSKYDKEIEAVRDWARQCTHLMNLTKWRITLWFEDWKTGENSETRMPHMAETEVESQYQTGTITFYMAATKERASWCEMRQTVIHEFLHIFLSPFVDMANNVAPKNAAETLLYAEEALVTRFEKLSIWNAIE